MALCRLRSRLGGHLLGVPLLAVDLLLVEPAAGVREDPEAAVFDGEAYWGVSASVRFAQGDADLQGLSHVVAARPRFASLFEGADYRVDTRGLPVAGQAKAVISELVVRVIGVFERAVYLVVRPTVPERARVF